jgi:hypothetical protein
MCFNDVAQYPQPNAAGSSKISSPIKSRTFKEGGKWEEICSFEHSCVPSPDKSSYRNVAFSPDLSCGHYQKALMRLPRDLKRARVSLNNFPLIDSPVYQGLAQLLYLLTLRTYVTSRSEEPGTEASCPTTYLATTEFPHRTFCKHLYEPDLCIRIRTQYRILFE